MIQFATFFIADCLYGIEVTQVQEIAQPLPTTPIHIAPAHVKGLINLRGQIATAIGLRELFNLPANPEPEKMSVVCRAEGNLLALQVDRIGDVIEVPASAFEPPLDMVPEPIRHFVSGFYKLTDGILSVLEIPQVLKFLNQ